MGVYKGIVVAVNDGRWSFLGIKIDDDESTTGNYLMCARVKTQRCVEILF